jgi:hypothetical protein
MVFNGQLLQNTINTTYRKATLQNKAGLPGWVAVAQQIPQKGIAEKILKADLVDTVRDNSMNFSMWDMPSRNNFNEEKLHDPLVMISSMFGGVPNSSEENRIQILEAMYDARHQAEERLWTGENLFTDQVNTLVKDMATILSLLYGENNHRKRMKARTTGGVTRKKRFIPSTYQREPLLRRYHYGLKEKKQKEFLLPNKKASTAYRTIVGYERMRSFGSTLAGRESCFCTCVSSNSRREPDV